MKVLPVVALSGYHNLAFVTAFVTAMNELRWCVIPLLAVMQGGEYAKIARLEPI